MRTSVKITVLLGTAILLGSCTTSRRALSEQPPDLLPEWLCTDSVETGMTSPESRLPPVLNDPPGREGFQYDRFPDRPPFPADLIRQVSSDPEGKPHRQSDASEPQSFFREQPAAPRSSAGHVSVVVNHLESPPVRRVVHEPAAEPLSRIEELYNNSSGDSGARGLRQFGYNQLRQTDSGLDPAGFDAGQEDTAYDDSRLMDPGGPVDADYLIGPGDEIVLRTTGALEMNQKLVVQRDGTIFIPEAGAVLVAGIRERDLNATLVKTIERQYNPVVVDASIGRLHAIRIMVLGYARTPGLFFLPANSTLIDALAAADGSSKDGSLRNVLLHRQNLPDQKIDLYGILKEGPEAKSIRLLSGDTIRIPALGPTAAVTGPLLEGIYELREEETLADLAGYAGGLNAFARPGRVQVERTEGGLKREISTVDYAAEGGRFVLQDGDTVVFDESYDRINDRVFLEGRMISPGGYPFREGMSASELLRFGDGFLMDASLSRVLLVRRLGRRRAFDIKPGDEEGEVRSELIWIDLPAVLTGEPQADLDLQRLDRLIVFSEADIRDDPRVSIMGAVRRPGTYSLSSGMRVRDLLLLAANTTSDAYDGRSMIVRRSRAAEGRHLDVKLIPFDLTGALKGDPEANPPLRNHDQVVVRRVQALQVRVDIQGRVNFPGTYILPEGSRIADLLMAAGGLQAEADLRAAVFTRESVRRQETEQLSDMHRRSREYFSRVRNQVTRDGYYNESVASQMALQGLSQLSANDRTFQATGRIVMDLTRDDFPEKADNLSLETGDSLTIPRRKNTVAVLGRIFNPNAFICREEERMNVKDYIEMAGGLQDDADEKQFYVLLASGEVHSAAQDGRRKLLRFVPFPGDTILVPQEPLKRSAKSSVMDTLSIMRQMAELGMVGAAIPNITGPVSPELSIESKTIQTGGSMSTGDSYLPMMQDSAGGRP